MILRKIFEVSDCQGRTFPSIDGFDRCKIHVVICQEHVVQKQSDLAMPMDACEDIPSYSESWTYSLSLANIMS
jgi:hypothetical protein